MVIANFRRSIPNRKRQLTILLINAAVLHVFVIPKFTADIVPGAAVPDLAFGYTPQQALAWYEAIGGEGRDNYQMCLFIDLILIIPSYTLLFGSHLLARQCYPEALCYLPVILASLDLFETSMHGYQCFHYDPEAPPSTKWLRVTSAATKAKHVTLLLVLGLCAYFSIRPKPKDKAS